MTSLRGRPITAVLVVDVQNDVVAGAHRRDEVVANIAASVNKARAEVVRATPPFGGRVARRSPSRCTAARSDD